MKLFHGKQKTLKQLPSYHHRRRVKRLDAEKPREAGRLARQ